MRSLILLLITTSLPAAIVADVRAHLNKGDFGAAESTLAQYKSASGVTGEYVEAYSWLGRAALALKQYERATTYADAARILSLDLLKKRKLDDERHLPIGFGASMEVQAQVMAATGRRSEAVSFLTQELKTWRATTIRTRIQKNIHLLSLEGQTAPALEIAEWLGAQPQSLASLKGKPVILFFWAHWCGDCKQQGPILARLRKENPGLVILMPTQRYGYGKGGADLSPANELKYIDQVRKDFYGELTDLAAPVSEENFKAWGSSTTPTLVLIGKDGKVRLYHPGRMTYEQLAPLVKDLIG
jgi:thiol-disulfide isomerase/thioredoxin